MICKKDVIVWFKELESYKRIDMMCTLLSMCLPFELRFLGTCLEELGRRDSQELRGIELRVNNPQDLAIDMIACQKGEPTDMKIRRKMALYLALIRACNRTCTTSTEIFRTLDVWGNRDFQNMTDMDTLQELLLVYTMAANHPVFSFEQHRRCIEIFENIKKNKLVSDPEPMPTSSQMSSLPHVQMDTMSTSPIPTTLSTTHLQHDLRHTIQPPSHQEMLHPHALHAMHIAGPHAQLLSCQPPLQVLSPITLQHPIPVDALHYMNLPNTIPADTNAILAHPNALPPRSYPPPPGPPSMEHPPSSSSPMPSQQSSPSSSRTTSPSRGPNLNVMQQQGMQQPQQQMRNVQQRLGGSSLKTTPPPILPPTQKHLDDPVINSDGSGNQLQTLIRLNGYRVGQPRLKTGTYITAQQQQQQQSPVNQQYQAIPSANYATGLNYAIQNLAISDPNTGLMHMPMDSSGMITINSNKSTGSDSGSSIGSSGEISPPETPANPVGHRDQQQQTQQPKHHHPHQTIYKQMTMGRLNGGRGDITLAPGGNAGTTNILQATSLGSNNSNLSDNSGGNTGNSMTVVSSNPNMNSVGTTVLINTSSSSGGSGGGINSGSSSGGILGNVQQPQQYNATYTYHTAQHMATTRPQPQLIPHNPAAGMAPPPPPATFRFPLTPNGEPIYPSPYHPTSIAFLAPSGGSASGAPPQPVILTASTASGVVTANTTATTQLQQLQSQPGGGAMIAVTPYNTISLTGSSSAAIVTKPVSCYNCGSQAHTGRDCPEASMDDVTRSAVYKLDYSVSAAPTPVTNVATTSTATGNSGGGSSSSSSSSSNTDNTISGKQQESMHASVTSAGTSSTAVAAISNIK